MHGADPRLRRRPDRARQQLGRAGAAKRSDRAQELSFAGYDRDSERTAAFYALIETAKFNGLDPETYLRDVLTRIADHPAKRVAELLPWSWSPDMQVADGA